MYIEELFDRLVKRLDLFEAETNDRLTELERLEKIDTDFTSNVNNNCFKYLIDHEQRLEIIEKQFNIQKSNDKPKAEPSLFPAEAAKQ